MDIPRNEFKQCLLKEQTQLGLWLGLANANVAELLAGAGFNWLLIDGEHAPNDIQSVLAQLRAIEPYPVHPIVRAASGDPVLIKQLLDIGVQTLMVPMVESAMQARQVVAATRYPPVGIRGVGSAIARASRWNQVKDYLERATSQICTLVQVESISALSQLDAIAAEEGVDGVFFGPADLAASMNLLGQPGHPDVVDAIVSGIRTVRVLDKAAGVLAVDATLARKYLQCGANFVAVGVDTTMLVSAAVNLATTYGIKSSSPNSYSVTSQGY